MSPSYRRAERAVEPPPSHRHRRRFLFPLAFLLLSSAPRALPTPSPPPLPLPSPLPLPPTGFCPPGAAPFDELMTRFLRDNDVPGGALAVVRRGRLVVARGYGTADLGTGEPVRPDSLFRIASLSKPITAVAVLRLVETGRLSLARPVIEAAGLEADLPPAAELDPRWREVTLERLLHHTAGFDREASFDPMFRARRIARALGVASAPSPRAIARFMLRRRLDFDPGARYAYSNFGYSLLGRAVEKASGESYERFAREEVLAPLGIRSMRLGRTRRGDRAPGEVAYHARERSLAPSVLDEAGAPVPRPYGAWCLESMDAHGGWLASAIDLARFVRAFEDLEHPALLSRASVEEMIAPPPGPAGHDERGRPKKVWYGLGWLVRPAGPGRRGYNLWHAGLLPGTSTLMARRWDGLSWVVFFNRDRDPRGRPLAARIDPLLHRAAGAVKEWPAVDLFPRFAPPGAPRRVPAARTARKR